MITMKPILEPDVVALLNAGRFEGELEGYVMTDGGNYLGYCLYRVAQGVTTVLDVSAPDHMTTDGLVRDAVAKGENGGAKAFALNRENKALSDWAQAFVPHETEPVPTEKIFGHCS